jgi:hypothetical protein
MSAQYPNSGRLAPNKYKDNPKKPDLKGEIKMTREALRQLAMEQPGEEITIKLSAWNMEGQYGPWLRLSWDNYKKPEGQGYPPRQEYQQPRPVAPRQQYPTDNSDIPF